MGGEREGEKAKGQLKGVPVYTRSPREVRGRCQSVSPDIADKAGKRCAGHEAVEGSTGLHQKPTGGPRTPWNTLGNMEQ